MKTIINKLLFGKDAKFSGLIALSTIMLIALGCTCGSLDKFKDAAKDEKSTDSTNSKSTKDVTSSNSSKDSPFPSDDEASKKSTDAATPKKSSDKDMPSDAETETLVKDLIQQFKNGVENEDFSDMRNASSTAFKKTYTTDKINTDFGVFIKNKERVATILEDVGDMTPSYSEEPTITKKSGFKILTANGTFPTSPTTTFKTSYVLEKGDWKMLTIEMRMQ